MPTLKVRCPDCDANIRQSIDGDDESRDVAVVCPKCGTEFTAATGPESPPKRARQTPKTDRPPAKPAKRPSRRDEDDDDDRPRRKKRQVAGGNQTLILGAVAGGVLLVGGVVAAILALGGKDKTADAPGNDNPGRQEPGPGMPGPGDGGPVRPGGGGPGPIVPPGGNGGIVSPGGGNGEPVTPPKQDPEDFELPPGIKLPDPPVIRIVGSAVPPAEPLAKPPASPPLPPGEDPFERAKTFRVEGLLPKPPTLPPLAERPVLVLDARGHSGMIRGMFLTPDGSKVVTVSEDKSVRVWDMATGEVLHTVRFPGVPGHVGTLYAAALSPDGKRLAVGGIPLGDGKDGIPVYLVAVDSGRLEKAILGVRQTPFALEFTLDGRQLAVGCVEGTIQTFDVAGGRPVGETKQHTGNVRAIRFSRKGGRMVSLAADRTVRVWDAKATKSVALPLGDFNPAAVAWSPDGQTLALGSVSGEIRIVTPEGKEVKTIPGITDRGAAVQVLRLTFTPDGKHVVWGGIGRVGQAGVIEVASGRRRVAFPHHDNTVGAVHVSADGALAATMGGNNEETFVWRTADGTVVRKFVGSGQAVFGVRWSADGKSIAFGNVNSADAQWVHGVQHTFRLDEFGVGGPPDPAKYPRPKYEADGLQLVFKDRGNLEVRENGRFLIKFTPSPNSGSLLDAASLVPGRGMVLSAGDNLELVDPRSGKVLRRYSGHTGPVLGVAVSPDDRHFVTGSVDQTIRLWSVDREGPLLSLFVVGREWIAWTPEGYYACSAYGEQLIAWQVNAGVAKLPTVYPAARFRASMYQPALLKYIVPAGSVQLAMAMAKKFDAALVRAASVAEVLPPEVTLTDVPADGAVVDRDRLVVKASAKGSANQPVVAMRLLVDGRPFGGVAGVKRFDNPQATGEASWEVPLAQGPHWFAVIAESPVSKGMSRVVSLTRPGEPPKPNLYVLAMGVSDYPGDEMDLRYAASDARLLAKALQTKSKGVFGDIEIRVLADSDCTSKNVRTELDWLKSKMTPTDVAIVSFSGHGSRDPLGQFYLVTADPFEGDPRRVWLPGDEFKARLEHMPGKVVAILDACHSGTVAEQFRPQAGADGLVRDLVAEDAGVVVLCSSLGREYSLESPLTKAGFYTLGLVEGMGGHGDVDQDGVVYIHELALYSNVRVRQLSAGAQNPTVGRPPGIRPFPIAKP